MSGKAVIAAEAELQRLPQDLGVVGLITKGHQALTQVPKRRISKLAAQLARAASAVEHRYDHAELGVELSQAFQDRGSARPSADNDNLGPLSVSVVITHIITLIADKICCPAKICLPLNRYACLELLFVGGAVLSGASVSAHANILKA